MRKVILLFVSIMMLISTLTLNSFSVSAEEETNVGDEITETIDNGEGETNEVEGETNEVEGETNNDEEDETVIETETGDEDVPGEGEVTGDDSDEIENDEDPSDEIDKEEEEEVDPEELDEEVVEEDLDGSTAMALSLPIRITTNGDNLYLVLGNSDSFTYAKLLSDTPGAYVEFLLNGTSVKKYYTAGSTVVTKLYLSTFYHYSHKGGVTMDVRKLRDDKLPSGTYTLRLVVPGQQDREITNVNIENLFRAYAEPRGSIDSNQLRLSQLCLPAPTDVSVTTDSDGNLIVDSSDKAWLRALAQPKAKFVSTNNSGAVLATDYIGGGYISLDGITIQNEAEMEDATGTPVNTPTNTYYQYDEASKKVIVYKPYFVNEHIYNGQYNIVLSAEGYLDYSTSQTLDFKNAALTISNSQITTSLKPNGDLLIQSGTEDYLDQLVISPASDNRLSTGGRVMINNKYFYNTSAKTVLTKTNEGVVISAEDIKKAFGYAISGNANIKLCSLGYDSVEKTLLLPYIISDSGNTAVINVEKEFRVVTVNNESVTWQVSKKVDGSYVNTTDGVVISGNICKITSGEPGARFKVVSTCNGVTDTREFDVTAEGLKVVAEKITDTTYLGETDAVMRAKAYVKEEPLPEGTLSYKSNNTAVLEVNADGTLVPRSTGKATITAYVGNASATTDYTVYKYSQKEGLVVSPASIDKIEVGEEMALTATVDGKPVDVSDLTFKSSSKSVADTEENVVKAIKKGSAKITVSLKEDGATEKKATVAVNVIDRECNDLVLSIGSQSETAEFYDDVVGSKMDIVATATDMKGEDFTITTVKYVSSDTSVVAVSSSGEVTFKKAGSATITGTVTSNPKEHPVSATLSITILDFMPRLSQNQLYVNSYTKSSGSFMIVEAYKDHPDHLTFEADDISITGGYQIEEIAPETYKLIVPNTPIKTSNEILKIATNEGPIYEFDVKVNVNTRKPFVKYKAYGVLNTFTGENTLEIHSDSSLGRVESVTADWFDADWYRWQDWWPLEARSIVLKDPNVKSGDIFAKMEGYEEPVKSRVSFKVVNTKPKIKLSASSVSIYVPDGDTTTKNIRVQFEAPNNYYNTPSTIIVNGLGYVDEEFTSEWGSLELPIDPTKFDKSGTLTLSYKKDGWAGTVDNKLTVKKINKLPKVSLKSSSVKLNQLYNEGISIQAIVSGNNDLGLELSPMTVEPQGLNVANISGSNYLYVRLNDTGKTAAPGKYLYTLTPKFSNGEAGDPIKFTVEIYNKAATMSVSVKGEVNPINSHEYRNVIEGKIKLSNVNGIYFLPISVDSEYFELTSPTAYNGEFTLRLKDESIPDGTYEVPVKVTLDNGDELVKNIKAKVKRKAPKVSRQTSFEIFDTTNNETNVGSGYIYPYDFVAMTSEDKISVVADKNDGAFRFDVVSINEYGEIEYNIVLADGSKVKAGSKTTLTVTIKWEGDDGKPKYRTSTYKISISDISNKIKKKK